MDLTKLLTPGAVALDLSMYGLMMLLLVSFYKNYTKQANFRVLLSIALLITFCVFAFWDTDYYHYLSRFIVIHYGKRDISIEEIYTWIAENSKSYTAFRFYIWTSATILLILTAKRLKIPLGLFLLIFIGGFITKFSYGRVSLAMSITFYGFSLMVKPFRPRLVSFLLGLTIISAAFFFHKSAAFGIGIAVLSIMAFAVNRKIISVFVFSYPLMIALLGMVLAIFVQSNPEQAESLNIHAAQNYLNTETDSLGIGTIINNTLSWGCYYITCFIYVKSIFTGKYKHFPFSMKAFGTASFLTTAISTLFAFDVGASTFVFYYRLLFFAMIPTAAFLSYCIMRKVYPKLTLMAYLVAVAGVTYNLLYSLYLASIGGHTF